jgi:hypothetical protein
MPEIANKKCLALVSKVILMSIAQSKSWSFSMAAKWLSEFSAEWFSKNPKVNPNPQKPLHHRSTASPKKL